MKLRGGARLGLLAAALACFGCAGPPPTHALVVRHPERKCALIWFSSCAALLGPREPDADAGVE